MAQIEKISHVIKYVCIGGQGFTMCSPHRHAEISSIPKRANTNKKQLRD